MDTGMKFILQVSELSTSSQWSIQHFAGGIAIKL